jgi:predicted P-loop ATPase/GTPase
MANNLFISYDLNSPGQDYSSVIAEIKSLGVWAKIQKSYWYINSTLTASQVVDRVWKKMDSNDSLIVVDSTNNNASWQNLSDEVANHIKNQWAK